MVGETRGGWRGENKRSYAPLAVAVAVIAVLGFGVSGAFVAAAAEKLVDSGLFNAADHSGVQVPTLIRELQKSMDLAKGKGGSKVKKTTSGNWAGYAATSKGDYEVTEAYTVFFVPSISCGSVEPTLSDQWTGIDGFSSSTVEQEGVTEYCTTNGGSPTYVAWFEFYPENVDYVMDVSAGDEIEAYTEFSYATDVFTVVLSDLTSSTGFYTFGNPESGVADSAECISENVVGEGTYYLADYGTQYFDACEATISGYFGGIGGLNKDAHATVYEITQIGPISGLTDQTPSKLYTDIYADDEFAVTWDGYD
jgi:hypothetical protein